MPIPDRARPTRLRHDVRAVVRALGRRSRLTNRAVTSGWDVDCALRVEDTERLRRGPGSGGSNRARTNVRPRSPRRPPTVEDKLEAVAAGQAVAFVAANDRHLTLRDDIVTVAVAGVEPCHVVVATRRDDPYPLVGEFRRAAKADLTGR